MNLFTSPLKKKIQKRIAELTQLRVDNVVQRNGKTHLSEEYSKLLLEDSNNAIRINELKRLVK